MGDLIVAANELERKIRREEALAAATSERERIARELHDGVAKSVSVLSLEIASVAARAPDELQPRLARFEVLRVLDEALENAERHANGTRTHARLAVDGSALHLVVEDDGRGIGPVAWTELASQGHFGLLGMRERAALLDADLRLEARSGGGTRVSLDVPLNGGAP